MSKPSYIAIQTIVEWLRDESNELDRLVDCKRLRTRTDCLADDIENYFYKHSRFAPTETAKELT